MPRVVPTHGTPSSSPVRRILLDLLIGSATTVGLWFTVVPSSASGRTWQLLLALLAVLSVVVRSWIPLGATILAVLATVVAWSLGATADPGIVVGLCLFALAERRGARVFPWWLWLSAVLLSGAGLVMGGSTAQDVLRVGVLSGIVVSSAWALGTRSRQVKQETAARTRDEERLRLAREVHDVLSHSLGTIGVQAGVAAHVTSLGPDELRRILRDIESDARASLSELRDLLQAERADPEESPGAPLTASIRGMAHSLERAGIHVHTDVSDDVNALPLVQSQMIRRVLQEAITNVIRHSGASRCRIGVGLDHQELTIEVSDDGHGTGGALVEGHGLTGMRERMALLGGQVEFVDAGDRTQGFLVRAVVRIAGGER